MTSKILLPIVFSLCYQLPFELKFINSDADLLKDLKETNSIKRKIFTEIQENSDRLFTLRTNFRGKNQIDSDPNPDIDDENLYFNLKTAAFDHLYVPIFGLDWSQVKINHLHDFRDSERKRKDNAIWKEAFELLGNKMDLKKGFTLDEHRKKKKDLINAAKECLIENPLDLLEVVAEIFEKETGENETYINLQNYELSSDSESEEYKSRIGFNLQKIEKTNLIANIDEWLKDYTEKINLEIDNLKEGINIEDNERKILSQKLKEFSINRINEEMKKLDKEFELERNLQRIVYKEIYNKYGIGSGAVAVMGKKLLEGDLKREEKLFGTDKGEIDETKRDDFYYFQKYKDDKESLILEVDRIDLRLVEIIKKKKKLKADIEEMKELEKSIEVEKKKSEEKKYEINLKLKRLKFFDKQKNIFIKKLNKNQNNSNDENVKKGIFGFIDVIYAWHELKVPKKRKE